MKKDIPSALWFPLSWSKSSSSRMPEVPCPYWTTSPLLGPIRRPTGDGDPHPEEGDEWLPEDDVQLAEPTEFSRSTGTPPKILHRVKYGKSKLSYDKCLNMTGVLPRPVRAQLMARSLMAISLGWISMKGLCPIPMNTLSCIRISVWRSAQTSALWGFTNQWAIPAVYGQFLNFM